MYIHVSNDWIFWFKSNRTNLSERAPVTKHPTIIPAINADDDVACIHWLPQTRFH